MRGLPAWATLWRRWSQCLRNRGVRSEDVRSVGGFLRACVRCVQRGPHLRCLRSAGDVRWGGNRPSVRVYADHLRGPFGCVWQYPGRLRRPSVLWLLSVRRLREQSVRLHTRLCGQGVRRRQRVWSGLRVGVWVPQHECGLRRGVRLRRRQARTEPCDGCGELPGRVFSYQGSRHHRTGLAGCFLPPGPHPRQRANLRLWWHLELRGGGAEAQPRDRRCVLPHWLHDARVERHLQRRLARFRLLQGAFRGKPARSPLRWRLGLREQRESRTESRDKRCFVPIRLRFCEHLGNGRNGLAHSLLLVS